VSRHRRLLTITAGFLVLILLAALVWQVHGDTGLARVDQAADDFFKPYRSAWLLKAFLWVTAIGTGPSLAAMLCCITALLWSGGRGPLLVPFWVTFAGAQATTWTAKYIIGRPRPVFLPNITEWNPSFPSGHATATTALIGMLAYVVAIARPPGGQRAAVAACAVAAIGLICFSRLFLGVHFLTDVTAGILVGIFWLLVGTSLAARRRQTAPKEA
jgi:undecaprenyl-diphosphatase